jgi:hypothetical protein
METYEKHEFPAGMLTPKANPDPFGIDLVRQLAEDTPPPEGTNWGGLSRVMAINERIEQRKALAEHWKAENPVGPT